MLTFRRDEGETVEQVAEGLLGTCQSYDHTQFTKEEIEQLNYLVAPCENCGWNYDPQELCFFGPFNEVCDDCVEDMEEEDGY